jgi:hypothetical protein
MFLTRAAQANGLDRLGFEKGGSRLRASQWFRVGATTIHVRAAARFVKASFLPLSPVAHHPSVAEGFLAPGQASDQIGSWGVFNPVEGEREISAVLKPWVIFSRCFCSLKTRSM